MKTVSLKYGYVCACGCVRACVRSCVRTCVRVCDSSAYASVWVCQVITTKLLLCLNVNIVL